MKKVKVRDLSIDYAKGIAILLVYMGHSILYYPSGLFEGWQWKVLGKMIVSCNMPLFFFISGLLFAYSKKSNREVVKDKVRRLLVPYLFTMMLVIIAKQFLPADMSAYHVGGGVISWISIIFVYGGERWFVYVLMWIFLLCLFFRKISTTKWIGIPIVTSFVVTMVFTLPKEFKINWVVWYISYFLIGMYLNQFYERFRKWNTKYAFCVIVVFVMLNIVFVRTLMTLLPLKIIVLPLTGIVGVMTFSWLIDDWCKKKGKENAVAKYIAYCGKYSLQFYLFTFAYPVIRYVVVIVLHITSPLPVFMLVFVIQLVVMTVIVEVTRRIKLLKIPMGY